MSWYFLSQRALIALIEKECKCAVAYTRRGWAKDLVDFNCFKKILSYSHHMSLLHTTLIIGDQIRKHLLPLHAESPPFRIIITAQRAVIALGNLSMQKSTNTSAKPEYCQRFNELGCLEWIITACHYCAGKALCGSTVHIYQMLHIAWRKHM